MSDSESILVAGIVNNRNTHREYKAAEIRYIRSKVNWTREQVESEVEDYPENFLNRIFEAHRDKFERIREQSEEAVEQRREDEGDISVTIKVGGSFFGIPLYYHLENYIFEMKRCIEFTLVNLKEQYSREKEPDFSYRKFLKHIKGETDQKTDFVEKLEKDYPDFVGFIEEEMKFFWGLGSHRDVLVHEEIDVGVEHLEIEADYEEGMELEEYFSEMPEEPKFLGDPLSEKMEEFEEILQEFLNRSEDVANSLFAEYRKSEIERYLSDLFD